MDEIVKALNTMNEILMSIQNNIHIDLVVMKEELKKANEFKQKEIDEEHVLADRFVTNDQKLGTLKECLNTVVSIVNQHSETLKTIMDCFHPFVDGKGMSIGNYDCCRDGKKRKKKK